MCGDEPRLAGHDCGGGFTTRVEQRRGNDQRTGDHQGHSAPSQQTLVRTSFFRHVAPPWVMLPGSAPSNKESVRPPPLLLCGTVTETFWRENAPVRLWLTRGTS